MAEPGFLPADVNDLYRTADQLVFVDYALQMSIARKLLDLALRYRDLSSILAHRFDPDSVTCLAFDVIAFHFS